MVQIKIEGRTPEERETYYQFKLAELYNEIRSLKKKVKRRDNKIIELEKEIKRLKNIEKTDIEIIHAALPDLFKKTDTRYKDSSHEMDHEDMGG